MADQHRIGLVIGQLHRGGAEKQLVKLALGLQGNGRFLPLIYCMSSVVEPYRSVLEDHGIRVRTLTGSGRGGLKKVLDLRRAAIHDRLDILHAFLMGPSVQGALAGLGPPMPPLICSIRTSAMERPILRKILESWALGRARAVTVNSRAAVDYAVHYYNVSPGSVHFIANGVDRVAEQCPAAPNARKALGLEGCGPVVLGLFRLSPEKNLELFCDVVESALGRFESGCCLIAGDGPLRARLEGRVAASRRPELFRILGPRDDVPLLLAASDVLLMTSRFEGMPNGILEAMSAGLPVVSTCVGGVPDLVEDGTTGRLCAPDDKDALVRALEDLLGDPRKRERFGQSAKHRADTQFTVEKMVAKHEILYEGLCGRPAG